jgi:hypothetical protein
LAVDINIPGIGVVSANNAAQDSTLNAILSAIQAQTGKTTNVSSAGLSAANQKGIRVSNTFSVLGDAASNTGDQIAGAGKSASHASSMFTAASTQVFSSFGMLASQSTSTGGMLKSVGQGIAKLGGAARGLAESVPHIGPILGAAASTAATGFGLLVGVLSRNVEQFEKVSASGGSFGNSLMKFREISNQAGLSTEMMANVAQKAGESLSAFGGTTEAGGRIFAKHNKSMQTEYGAQMLRMGIGFEEQGVMLAEFMGDLAATGQNMDQLDTGELNKSFMTLTTQQKQMAQYNGVTLEAERQKQKALKKDAQLQAALLDLPPEQRKAAMLMISQADEMVAGSGQAIKEMFLNGGEVFTAESSALLNELPGYSQGLKDTIAGIKGGNLEFTNSLHAAAGTITQGQLKNVQEIVKASAMGATGPVVKAFEGAFLSIEETINKVKNNTIAKIGKDTESLKKPPSELDDNAVRMAQASRDLAISMDKAVSDVMTSSAFNTGLNLATQAINGLANATNAVTNITDSEKSFFSRVGDGLMNTMGNYLQTTKPMDFTDSAIKGFQEAFTLGGIPSQASPAVVSSRATLPNAPAPELQGGTGVTTLPGGAGNDTLNNTSVIPDDVADAIRQTPVLLQQLTEQVRRSSDENARAVVNGSNY